MSDSPPPASTSKTLTAPPPPARVAWVQPKLERYGSVRCLVRGGSGPMGDGMLPGKRFR